MVLESAAAPVAMKAGELRHHRRPLHPIIFAGVLVIHGGWRPSVRVMIGDEAPHSEHSLLRVAPHAGPAEEVTLLAARYHPIQGILGVAALALFQGHLRLRRRPVGGSRRGGGRRRHAGRWDVGRDRQHRRGHIRTRRGTAPSRDVVVQGAAPSRPPRHGFVRVPPVSDGRDGGDSERERGTHEGRGEDAGQGPGEGSRGGKARGVQVRFHRGGERRRGGRRVRRRRGLRFGTERSGPAGGRRGQRGRRRRRQRHGEPPEGLRGQKCIGDGRRRRRVAPPEGPRESTEEAPAEGEGGRGRVRPRRGRRHEGRTGLLRGRRRPRGGGGRQMERPRRRFDVHPPPEVARSPPFPSCGLSRLSARVRDSESKRQRRVPLVGSSQMQRRSQVRE
mmetsp:Transcript_43545/g.132522  ORF Transcript_43545/g.132522 Transcript_43545/m.132522 type:complete len:390 (-) Transcript_43545:1324-2493(-)